MYQERISATETKRLALYPLRYAILRQAYRLGRTSADIAHFYFELEGFYVPQDGATVLDPLEVLGATAHVREIDSDVNASSPITDESAARARLEDIAKSHMAYQPDATNLSKSVQYYPLICRVRDLRPARKLNKVISPSFDLPTRSSHYNLRERQECILDLGFYVPTWCTAPLRGSTVTLTSDELAFATSARRSLAVESRYDEQAWLVVAAVTETPIRRELTLQTDLKVPADLEPININLTMPVTIRPRRLRRVSSVFLELTAAFGLALATGALALSTKPPSWVHSEWLLPAIVAGYALWFTLSAVARLWRP
jgi:hypothetical protein